jgi:hypothetical protein
MPAEKPKPAHDVIEDYRSPFTAGKRLSDFSYHRGYVKWVDEKSIEKMNAPGKVQYDDDLSAYKEIIQIDHPLPKY